MSLSSLSSTGKVTSEEKMAWLALLAERDTEVVAEDEPVRLELTGVGFLSKY